MDLSKLNIETDRLRLVPVNLGFVENIFLEYRDPVIKYMNYGAPENIEILKDRMKSRENEMKEGSQLFLVILLKETGEFLGCMALEDLKKENPEMGGWLKKSAHGHGYGREAAYAIKKWAEENIEYDHILWPCAIDNKSSCKLAESLGGKIHRKYEKTTVRGTTWTFLDYWIPKKN